MSLIDRAKLLRDRGRIDCINCGGEIAKADERCRWCRSIPSLLDVARLARALDPLDTIEPPAVYRTAARQGALQCAACGAALPEGETISCSQCGATLAITSLAEAHAQVQALAPALRAAAARPSPEVVKRRLDALDEDLPRRREWVGGDAGRGRRAARPQRRRDRLERGRSCAGNPCSPSSRSRSWSGSDGTRPALKSSCESAPTRSPQRGLGTRPLAHGGARDRHPLRARRDRALGHARLARRGARARAAVPAHRPGARRRQRAVVAAGAPVARSGVDAAARRLRPVRLPLPALRRAAHRAAARGQPRQLPVAAAHRRPRAGVPARHRAAAGARARGGRRLRRRGAGDRRRSRRERRPAPGATSPPPARPSSGRATRC